MKPLNGASLRKLINKIAAAEKITLAEEVVDKIISNADNSARNALVLLGKVQHMEDTESQLEVIDKSSGETAAIQIARTLFNPRTTWTEMAKVLKANETEEPELMRWMILGYAKAVLLGGGPLADRAFNVIQIFRDHFWDCKQAGLVGCCYEIITGK